MTTHELRTTINEGVDKLRVMAAQLDDIPNPADKKSHLQDMQATIARLKHLQAMLENKKKLK
jgi:hypothetical protein